MVRKCVQRNSVIHVSIHHHEEEPNKLRQAITAIAAIVFGSGLLIGWMKFYSGAEQLFFGISLVVVSAPVFYDAARTIRKNPFNEHVLMSIAALSAGAIGVWGEGAAVLLLFNVAENLEDYAVDRVRRIAEKVAALLPKRAVMKKNGQLVEVDVEKLSVGDVIVVKPGWRIPVDGLVLASGSNIDQSTVTGESIPVLKTVGDRVLSGTLAVDGSIEVKVEKSFRDSTVGRIIELVTVTREKKMRVERFIDKFSRYYTPSMIIIAALIALIPPLFLGGEISKWLYRSLIALVIACPSALVISTPVTALMGLTRAMWSGILVKGGIYLEEVAKINVIGFDKTGTLTKGKLSVSKVTPMSGISENEVLQLAAIAESRSSHPISEAVLAEAKRRGLTLSEEVQVVDVAGKGIEASIRDEGKVLVGSLSFLAERGVELDYNLCNNELDTLVGVAKDSKITGYIVVEDELRDESKETIERIKASGVRVAMLTGDNEKVADKIAREVGIQEIYHSLLPEDKVKIAEQLRQKYGYIIIVGDGVNDAPVLAVSNVGIAVGTAGNDIAIESADVALMSSDLRKIPYLVKLGSRTVTTIKFNIGLALGVKLLMIALGAFGLIPLWFAVLGDDGLTLLIIANALPILRVKDSIKKCEGRDSNPVI